jgi:hypothetical protein
MQKKETETKKKDEKKLAIKKVMERVKHNFDDTELADLSREIAQLVQDHIRLIEEKKSVASQYASQEKELNIKITASSQLIRDGYEFRQKPCLEIKDYENEMVYLFLVEEVKEVDLKKFTSEAELITYLTQDEEYNPVKSRRMRGYELHEQQKLFDEQEQKEQAELDEDMKDSPPDGKQKPKGKAKVKTG